MWAVVLALACLACNCIAQQFNFLQQPFNETSFYVAPVNYSGALEGPIGNSSASYWYLAQWDIPDPIPLSVQSGTGPCAADAHIEWWTANENVRVCTGYNQNGLVLELAQSGGNLPCGNEYDLFVSPNSAVYPKYPQNDVPIGQTPPITNFSTINFSFGAELNYAAVQSRCGNSPQCSGSGNVDYGYATAALTLNNLESQQSLFFQISLWDSRMNDGCSPYENPCNPSLSWFFSTNPYGSNYAVSGYGAPCLTYGGGRVYYNFNVIPSINEMLQNAPSTMDTDPNHWRIGGMYIGLGMQGQITSTLILDSINLVGEFTN